MAATPSQPSRNWPLIVLIVMAIGGPLTAGLIFAEQVTQNPWQALGIALLYELLVFVFGIVGKVWRNLESKWVERIANWIDIRVQELFSRYRKRYLQHLIYRHRDFDVKGLSTQGTFALELERVFVELTIVPQPRLAPNAAIAARNRWPHAFSGCLVAKALSRAPPRG